MTTVPGLAVVRRTAPDGKDLVVGPEVAGHQIESVRVVRNWHPVIEPSHDPGAHWISRIEVIGRNSFLMVVSVQDPGDTHLTQVTHTVGPLGLGLCRTE